MVILFVLLSHCLLVSYYISTKLNPLILTHKYKRTFFIIVFVQNSSQFWTNIVAGIEPWAESTTYWTKFIGWCSMFKQMIDRSRQTVELCYISTFIFKKFRGRFSTSKAFFRKGLSSLCSGRKTDVSRASVPSKWLINVMNTKKWSTEWGIFTSLGSKVTKSKQMLALNVLSFW